MPADLSHPSFRQPAGSPVPLWRYMDLSKYASLLQKRCLVFTRADCLGDPFEGSWPAANAGAAAHIIEQRKVTGESGPIEGLTDEQIVRLFEELRSMQKVNIRTTYINCWHMNDSESAAMWKIYSQSSDSVCVRTDYASLASVLPDSVRMGLVEYVDYSKYIMDISNLYNTFMTKRRSFSHEREVRAVLWDSDCADRPDVETAKLKEINIDVMALIKAVYVNPGSPDWFRDVVENLSRTYGLNVTVERSELGAAPSF